MFDHVSTGKLWKPKAAELNAMIDAAAAFVGGQGVASGDKSLTNGLQLRPPVVRVQNTLGAVADRYCCYGLGDSRWVLDENTNTQEICFDLVAYDEATTLPAVVQETIDEDSMGTAVIYGHTLVQVTGDGETTDRAGSPNESGLIVPGSGQAVRFNQARPTDGGVVLGVLGASASGNQVTFYKSEEDRYRIARYWFWARRCDVQGVVASGTSYEKVYDWPQAGSRMLINMRAGLLMQVANIGGTLYYVYGPPPPTSYPPSPAEIYIHGAASPPSASDVFEFDAEVGVAYSKTIDVVGIGSHTSVTASDLPPGITYTQVTYTLEGTPTTEGVYFIKFTGATGSGNAIRLLKLTVWPEGGGPLPPVEEP